MDYVHEYAAGDEVESNDLNGVQRQAAALFQLTGGWRGRHPRLSSDGTNVTVAAHNGGFAGTTQADAVRLPGAGSTNVTLGSPSASTWYYVYAFNSGTYDAPALSYEVSTVAPDATRCFKSTDGSRIYVGCFRTGGSSTPRPFTMHGRRYIWRRSAASGTPFVLGTYTGSGSPHTVSLAAVMPPHARVAILRLLVRATGVAVVSLQTAGDSAGAYDVASIAPVAGDILADTIELEVGASNDVTLSVANADVTVECIGFQE